MEVDSIGAHVNQLNGFLGSFYFAVNALIWSAGMLRCRHRPALGPRGRVLVERASFKARRF